MLPNIVFKHKFDTKNINKKLKIIKILELKFTFKTII